ncbi:MULTISPECIES: ABC transporter permease subunit [Clostridium]|uniref:ABC transporter permease n=1 Tax=Clostridium sporogenes TaxID=1509 RepID=A0A7X5P8Y5_CLOSG|nr:MULTISPECIES: ABC transporter permease subunit [Clostridium]AJD31880.1 ABC-2 transporter family protein [Clostridium botulinum Prevot_594]HDK7156292.1 ABC transporter permease [Clostridium botulinum]KOY66989.1 ABC transporter permease [Clostridium sporogenes]KRU37462.1 ABC-2 family transporter protein [Clostridium sporogenes]MBE6058195.1 ABC transporter permease [Clostridium sp.]
MELFKSEFERLWKNKLTLFCFILIPLAIIGSSKYYLGNNLKLPITNDEYTSFGNYPFMMFQEMLITLFNFMAILFVCISITEEYRKGQIRLIMIRGYSFKEIYFAKIASIISTMVILFVAYFILSTAIGYFIAPKLYRVKLFFHSSTVSNLNAILYSLKYYALGFLTVLAILSVFALFSVTFKSSTGTIAACICFLMGSFIFSKIIEQWHIMLVKNPHNGINLIKIVEKLYLSTIPQIQYIGICFVLAEKPILNHWILGVLAAYIIIFTFITCTIFSKRDNFI